MGIRIKSLSSSELEEILKEKGIEIKINGWELLGKLMVLEVKKELGRKEKETLAKIILEKHLIAKSIVLRKAITGDKREPIAELIAGEKSETIYKENGCFFKIDPTKVMFSFGNKEERRRMATISNEKEVVLDMFTCVGQFTMPLAKYSKPKKVYAIEKNPAAFEYLKENISLNRLTNVFPILGDCREVSPKGVADRIIMGYLFNTSSFLPAAMEALKEKGIIHYHTTSLVPEIEETGKKVIREIEKLGADAELIRQRTVKSYAPMRAHIVLDILVRLR